MQQPVTDLILVKEADQDHSKSDQAALASTWHHATGLLVEYKR